MYLLVRGLMKLRKRSEKKEDAVKKWNRENGSNTKNGRMDQRFLEYHIQCERSDHYFLDYHIQCGNNFTSDKNRGGYEFCDMDTRGIGREEGGRQGNEQVRGLLSRSQGDDDVQVHCKCCPTCNPPERCTCRYCPNSGHRDNCGTVFERDCDCDEPLSCCKQDGDEIHIIFNAANDIENEKVEKPLESNDSHGCRTSMSDKEGNCRTTEVVIEHET
jgi:hypothetical protein